MMVSAGLTIIPLEELRDYIFMCSSFAASAVTGKGWRSAAFTLAKDKLVGLGSAEFGGTNSYGAPGRAT